LPVSMGVKDLGRLAMRFRWFLKASAFRKSLSAIGSMGRE